MQNPNTKRFWDRKNETERDNLLKSPFYLDKNKIVANYLRDTSGCLLDVGIGYGVLEKLLVENETKLSLFGIDISARAIGTIKRSVNGEFIVASVLEIPFPNGFFDYAVALDIFEHFRGFELERLLKEICRVLKHKSHFIVSVPLNESREDREANRHLTSFTESSIAVLLKKYGFDIKKTITLYAFKKWYLIKTLIAKLFKLKTPNLIVIFCKKK